LVSFFGGCIRSQLLTLKYYFEGGRHPVTVRKEQRWRRGEKRACV